MSFTCHNDVRTRSEHVVFSDTLQGSVFTLCRKWLPALMVGSSETGRQFDRHMCTRLGKISLLFYESSYKDTISQVFTAEIHLYASLLHLCLSCIIRSSIADKPLATVSMPPKQSHASNRYTGSNRFWLDVFYLLIHI